MDVKLYDTVRHKEIYDGNQEFVVIGIRLNQVELQGDFSGGTHNVCQRSWVDKKGLILNEKPTEYIICSAIHFLNDNEYVHQPVNIKKGFVICGRRHHNCFMSLGITSELLVKGRIDHGIKDEIEGFLTNTNRFVEREEGARIALAAGQIKEATTRLYSEDLY
jgi:hypothetical protein